MNRSQPPKYAFRFLEWFCPSSLYEGVEGDLAEQFEADIKSLGVKKAKKRLYGMLLSFSDPKSF